MAELDRYGTETFLAGTDFDLESMRPIVSFDRSVG